MRRFFALTLVQFRGLLSTTTAGRRRARMWPSAAAWGLLALLLLVMSAAYSFPLVSALGPAHAGLVLLLMPIVGGLATVLLGAQGAGTFVFGGRDNDLLLSLPIPRTTLAAAKIAAPPQIQMDRMPIMRRSYSIPSGGATSNAPASSRLP